MKPSHIFKKFKHWIQLFGVIAFIGYIFFKPRTSFLEPFTEFSKMTALDLQGLEGFVINRNEQFANGVLTFNSRYRGYSCQAKGLSNEPLDRIQIQMEIPWDQAMNKWEYLEREITENFQQPQCFKCLTEKGIGSSYDLRNAVEKNNDILLHAFKDPSGFTFMMTGIKSRLPEHFSITIQMMNERTSNE